MPAGLSAIVQVFTFKESRGPSRIARFGSTCRLRPTRVLKQHHKPRPVATSEWSFFPSSTREGGDEVCIPRVSRMKCVYALGVWPGSRPRRSGKDTSQRAEDFHTVQRGSLWIDLHGRMRGHQRQSREHVHVRSLASCWLPHGYN